MKKLILVLLIMLGITPLAFSQNVRWDFSATTTNTLSGNLIPLFVIPNAPISFYVNCTSLPCATPASVYPSISSTSACPADRQVVLPLENVCRDQADVQGNFGGWFVPGQYQYTITEFGRVRGPFPITVGGVGGGGGGSNCVPTNGGGPYPTTFGFGELVYLTNDGTGCTSDHNLITDGNTLWMKEGGNIEMDAPTPRQNDEYSLVDPDHYHIYSSTGNGGTPGIHMEIDDSDAAVGGGIGGGTPLYIYGAAVKNDPTASWSLIDLYAATGGADKSTTFDGILIEASNGGAKVQDFAGVEVQMNGGRATHEEAAYKVETVNSEITTNYCDFLAQDPSGPGPTFVVREALGCGTTNTNTFAGPIFTPQLNVTGTGAASSMKALEGTPCPTPAAGYDILCADSGTHSYRVSHNGAAYFSLSSGGGSSAFSAITSGTNNSAAMILGTGASIDVAGSGSVNATKLGGVAVTGTPSSGQVVTATGPTAATWQTPSGGGGGSSGALVLLEEHTASSSATLDFTTRNVAGQSGATFQSDYDTYAFEVVNVVPVTNNVALRLDVSTNGGSTWDTTSGHYDWVGLFSVAAGLPAQQGSGSDTAMTMGQSIANAANDPTGICATGRIFSPLSTTMTMRVNLLGGSVSSTTNSLALAIQQYVGRYKQLGTGINAVQFKIDSGNISTGTIRIYGVSK